MKKLIIIIGLCIILLVPSALSANPWVKNSWYSYISWDEPDRYGTANQTNLRLDNNLSCYSTVVNQVGQINQSYFFDGANDFCEFDRHLSFSDTRGFTLVGWINTTDTTADNQPNRLLIFQDAGALKRIRIFQDKTTEKLIAYMSKDGATFDQVDSNNAINTGNWIFFAVRYNGTGFDMWINGTKQTDLGVMDFAADWRTQNNNKKVGADITLADKWDGYIDDLAFFNETLTNATMQAIYAQGLADKRLDDDLEFNIDLIFPTNTTRFYGNYNGSLIFELNSVNGTANCDLNSTTWTNQSAPPYGNGTIGYINTSGFPATTNLSLFFNCTDGDGQTDNLTFWFALDTMLDIEIYDEVTNTLLPINASINLISTGFAQNYTSVNGYLNITTLLPGAYTIEYSHPGYDQRAYYFTVLEGRKNTVRIFFLNSSLSDRIIITLYDQYSDEAANITIKLQRYMVSTNSYVTTSMARTNFEGEAVLYVELYDVFYRMQYETNTGRLLELTDPSPFLRTDPTDTINLEEDIYESWQTYDTVFYNLTFLNSSGVIYARFLFSDTTNVLRYACLKVDRYDTEGITNICNNCTGASAATLTCIIDHTVYGQYKAMGLIDTDTETSKYTVGVEFWQRGRDIDWGDEGLYYTLMIVGTMTLMGLSTITGSVVFLVISIIGVSVIGLIKGVTLGMVFYIVMTGGIIIFIARKATTQ